MTGFGFFLWLDVNLVHVFQVVYQWTLNIKPSPQFPPSRSEKETKPPQSNVYHCYIARLWLVDSWSRALTKFKCIPTGIQLRSCCPHAVFVCLFVFALWQSKYITKHLMYGLSGNKLFLFPLESWCFLWLHLGKHQDPRENKTNCFPRDHKLSVYYMLWFKW